MRTLLHTAALLAEGGLPALLTSGTAIVVYIFVILTAIAALVVVILAGGREKKSTKTAAPSHPASHTPDSAALPLHEADAPYPSANGAVASEGFEALP